MKYQDPLNYVQIISIVIFFFLIRTKYITSSLVVFERMLDLMALGKKANFLVYHSCLSHTLVYIL